jgi:hypothetical protein
MDSLPPVATAGAAVNAAVTELAAIPKWVCWRAIKRGNKITKVPYTPAGSLASSTDPVTWSSFNECWTAAFADGHFDGIGIVLDGTDGLAGGDIDGCVQDGVIDVPANEIVTLFSSYSEISPSGTGIRIICRGTTPEPGRRNDKIELYSSKRFLTITGRHITTAPDQICDAQTAIDTLWAKHFSEPRRRTNSNGSGRNGVLPPYLDQEAIDALLQDPTAAAYWRQDPIAAPETDQSPSGWDIAFAGYLADKGFSREVVASCLRTYRQHHEPTKGKQDRLGYIWATVDQVMPETVNNEQPQPTRQYSLPEVHEVFRKWLGKEYDLDTLNAVLATAAAEKLLGDPLWLLVISGPGNAKTETVQALRGAGAHVTSTITSEGALLSASSKRDRSKTATGGLLRKIGARGLLVIKDVTSILSADRHIRGPVLAAMREVYDGRWERNVGTDGGQTLTWEGRIGVVGAVTTAWDAAHGVISTMGDRFVLIRANSRLGRCLAGRRAIRNTGQEAAMREEMAYSVGGLIAAVDADQHLELNDDEIERILQAADVATLARTGVELDYRGDVIDAHAPEMPTRFAKQLTQMLRGGVAIGMDRDAALVLAIRCARDSMLPLRLDLLLDVAEHPGSRIIDIRRRLEKPRATVDRQLQALHILGLLTCDEVEEERLGKPVQIRHYSLVSGLDLSVLTIPEMCVSNSCFSQKRGESRDAPVF